MVCLVLKALMRSASGKEGSKSAETEVTTKAGYEGFDEKCPRQLRWLEH